MRESHHGRDQSALCRQADPLGQRGGGAGPAGRSSKRSNIFASPQIGQDSSYYPFGEERTATGQDRTKFATYYRDNKTGFDYAMNRYYNNSWGRFTTADPSGTANLNNPGSWNQYAYVGGDPINHNDPSGLGWECQPNVVYDGEHCKVWGETCVYVASVIIPPPGYYQERARAEHPRRPSHNPCSLMAERAQQYVDRTSRITLDQFNAMFADYYVGTHMTNDTLSPEVLYYNVFIAKLPKGAGDPYTGQADFATQFKEPTNDFNDQTHHFAAYLSAGLTGQYWAARAHWTFDNAADTRLGKAGYAMGEYLRNNPDQLKNIGQLIRAYICSGKTPAYPVP